MTDPVSDAWGDIAGWVAEHAPATHAALRPPAPPDRLAAAEAELGFPLGPELVAWWSRHDGAAFDGGQLLPGYVPYGIDAMLRSRRTWLEIAQDVWGEWARTSGAAQPAGGMAWAFLPELVPIAYDGSGNDLVIDFRAGPLRGCVKAYNHEEGALVPPPWSSLGELLSQVAVALRTGAPVGWATAAVEADRLVWRSA